MDIAAKGKTRTALVVSAGWNLTDSRAALRPHGVSVAAEADRGDALKGPLHVRRLVSEADVDLVVLKSADWSRQIVPQVFLASLALAGVPCAVLDEATGQLSPASSGRLAMTAATLPFVAVWAMCRALLLGARLSLRRTPVERGLTRSPESVIVIWLVRSEFQVGGAVTHAAGILSGFREMGLRVGLVTLSTPPPQFDGLYDDLEIVDPPDAILRALPFTGMLSLNQVGLEAVRRLAGRIKPSFIYQRHAAFVRIGLDSARGFGIPSVLEFNSPAVWSMLNTGERVPGDVLFLPIARRIERQVVSASSLVPAVSSNVAKMAVDLGCTPDRAVVVPNAVSTKSIRPAPLEQGSARRGGEQFRIGWSGTFSPWHGMQVFVEAMAKLPDTVSAVMIGHGEEWDDCRRLIDRLGLADRVELTGSLAHDRALAELAGCDILTSPHVSWNGQPFIGSPTKLFEFMALGRPIVASDLDQIGEIIEDGVTGVLVRPGDVEDLAKGLERVMGMQDRGESLGRAARLEAESRHTWEARAKAIVSDLGADQRVEAGPTVR